MKQGYLLKHLDMKEFEMEQELINRTVECTHYLIKSSVLVKATKTSTKIKSKNDY